MFNIIIIEDEEIERLALRKIISKDIEGVNLLEASTGTEALTVIRNTEHIDLILLDINIPRPSGLDILREIRSQQIDTKVIITTANDDFDMARIMISLKVNEYLLKPIKPQTLIQAIQNCLPIDQKQNQRYKDLQKQLLHLLDNNLYIQWSELIRDTITWAYSQPELSQQSLVMELITALQQIVKHKEWDSNLLKRPIEQLQKTNINKHNYYKTLCQVTEIANIIFDQAKHHTDQKLDPMQRALHYIERNLYNHLTLEQVANHTYVSACYLSRLFRKNMDSSFINYLTLRRINIAKTLLEKSDLSINNIALELSYNDANYFCRTFKKQTGVSPSEYRKQPK